MGEEERRKAVRVRQRSGAEGDRTAQDKLGSSKFKDRLAGGGRWSVVSS